MEFKRRPCCLIAELLQRRKAVDVPPRVVDAADVCMWCSVEKVATLSRSVGKVPLRHTECVCGYALAPVIQVRSGVGELKVICEARRARAPILRTPRWFVRELLLHSYITTLP